MLPCFSATTCVVVAFDGDGPLGSIPDVVLTTSDGGATWTAESVTGLPDSLLASISCPAASSCWLGGTVPPAGGGSGTPVAIGKGQGLLAWSGDGGSTWQRATVPAGVGPITDVTCPYTTTCYALGFVPSPSGMGPGEVVLLSTSGSDGFPT